MRSSLLAVLATAVAVSAQRCDDETITIQSDGDMDFYKNRCRDIPGDINIEEGVKVIDFGQISSIGGSVIVNNATELTSITANFLETIEKDLTLTSLTRLNTISLPRLQKVGKITIQTLPAITQLGFTNITEADSVVISDTVITSLDGINLRTCGTFDLNNNKYLKKINIGLQNVTDILSITFNAVSSVELLRLESINSTTLALIDSIKVPLLKEVKGSIELVNCTTKEFSAPNVTSVGDAVSFVGNTNLEKVSLPLLTDIGGTLLFANNPIKNITLEKLEMVGGAIDVSGEYDQLNLPKLEDVRGGCNIQTSSKLDCKPFDDKQADGTIKGDYLCTAEVESSELGGLGSNPESGTGKKKNGAGQIAFSFTALAVSALFSIAYVL